MTLVLAFKKSVANRARHLLRDGNGGIGAVTPDCAAEVAKQSAIIPLGGGYGEVVSRMS
jgi:hypothetical protein